MLTSPEIIAIAVAVLLLTWGVAAFNSLVSMRNRVQNAWADIDVQLKRRHDLIPNLVETARGYMHHERSIFEAVTQARARRAGCDAGFAPVTPLAQVMAALARDVAGREAFRRGGSSPPCYL